MYLFATWLQHFSALSQEVSGTLFGTLFGTSRHSLKKCPAPYSAPYSGTLSRSVRHPIRERAPSMLKPMNHAMNVPICDLASALLGTLSRSVRHPILLFAFSFIAFVLAVCRIYKCQYCGHDNATVVFSLNNACSKCKVLHIFDWK